MLRKPTLIALLIAVAITTGVVSLRNVKSSGGGARTAASTVETNDLSVDTAEMNTNKKGGNRVGRFFTAPFRAVGRLFGRGKDDSVKLRRLTEKDVKKFESAGLVRVEDSRSPSAMMPDMKESTAREHLTQGRAFLESGQLNEAIRELSRSVSIDPKLNQAHSLLAVAYERKGLRERAKEAHERALNITRNDAQALNNSGYSLYLNGDYKGAVDRLKRAAKLAPRDERILNNLALAQCRIGKYTDAYKSFARAGGEFTGRLNTANMLERAGNDAAAIKHYEAARRLQPTSSAILQRLIDVYQRTGRGADAESTRAALNVLTNPANKTIATAGRGN